MSNRGSRSTNTINWVDQSKWFAMPQQKRSRATMQRVLNAALELFASQGYDSTTPADIAKAAGVTTGSIYRRFPDKEAILYTIIEAFGRSRSPEVTRICDPVACANMGAEEIIILYIDMMFSAYDHDAGVIRIIERRRLVDPTVAQIISDLNEHVIGSFAGLLKPHSKLTRTAMRKAFRTLHTVVRGFLVHRILADPSIPEHDHKISDPELKACVTQLALSHINTHK
jgi:AcrR family transcriptional regulator